jgi:CubicO group peptidase (beta-lactamase class C family)
MIRRRLMFAALLILSVVAIGVAADAPRQVVATTSLETQADAVVAAAMKEQMIPAVSIAIARGDRTLVARGYGLANVELDVSASASTVYRIGSLTKQFTAAAVMRLVEAGKMTLDDPIEKYLPEYPVAGRRITIRHLLTHTSGIKSYTSLGPKFWDNAPLDFSHEKLIALFTDEPPDFQPGEKFLYNNSGYYLLGVILEKVTGETYGSHVKKALFEPLGLTSTMYCDNGPLIKQRAAGYQVMLGAVLNAPYLSMKAPFSAGALCSNVTDLVAWTSALMNGKVVTRASLEQMTTPAKLNDGTSTTYGFGLAIGSGEAKTISHGGGINGFGSYMTYQPKDGTTVVVLTNLGGAKPQAIASELMKPPSATSNGR